MMASANLCLMQDMTHNVHSENHKGNATQMMPAAVKLQHTKMTDKTTKSCKVITFHININATNISNINRNKRLENGIHAST